MARSIRIEYPGAHYHVMARGDGREAVFRVIVTPDGDFYAFGRGVEKIERFVEGLDVEWFDME